MTTFGHICKINIFPGPSQLEGRLTKTALFITSSCQKLPSTVFEGGGLEEDCRFWALDCPLNETSKPNMLSPYRRPLFMLGIDYRFRKLWGKI
jgi:hypothetical protein